MAQQAEDVLLVSCSECDYRHGYTHLGDVRDDLMHAHEHKLAGVEAVISAEGDYAVASFWKTAWESANDPHVASSIRNILGPRGADGEWTWITEAEAKAQYQAMVDEAEARWNALSIVERLDQCIERGVLEGVDADEEWQLVRPILVAWEVEHGATG